ncbi:MAG: phosphotransferase [Rhodospirillaceae bacterium]|nr:phosphotransferase [Rhodospirillaceae bacterium]MBT4486376.1 phosphotransferase [Rhodospirillaceae bacterium]MBT5191385.1 phosphotransferase [Rhodospirillaceae bacterium]MBT5896398.1 phosphotransferase [Rhodospirillaceae bacterium]MBT6426100.1 phosphotransferase [Rhodospirillaceae bacterium]
MEAAEQAATALLGDPVRRVSQQRGGGNNRLYRIEGADGRHYALKTYLHGSGDDRDRLGAEFGGLAFLRAQGLDSQVPRAVARDPSRHCALFGWVDGDAVDHPTPRDLFQALCFVLDLYRLAQRPEAAALPLASEACLSGAEVARQIDRRLDRLLAICDQRLRAFLIDVFAPAHEKYCDLAMARYEDMQLDFAQSIDHAALTLSPSDFGFHNAIRRTDGRLVFIDFEYFGWDDPVKLVADFLLHPGMSLDVELRRRFRRGAVAVFGGDHGFEARLRALFPLYALRWCLIVLNEFLPERWQRRDYAGAHQDREYALSTQLAKAKAMLRQLEDANEEVFEDD